MNDRDRQLARRMLAGDDPAFDEFFDGHFPGLYRFALSRVGRDHDTAEEVAQAAICRAIGKLETYRGEAALFTWLCTFCRHEISAHYRRHARQLRHVDLIEDTPEVRAALESIESDFDGPERAVQRTELARLVQVALDRLPGRYGDALEWMYIDSVPVKQIAVRLEISPKAAESLLTRARAAFRDAFRTLTDGPIGVEPS